MNAVTFSEFVTRTQRQMIKFLNTTVTGAPSALDSRGLPSGAVYLKSQNVILAATACGKGVFNDAIRDAARQTGADIIIIAHQGRYPVPCILDDVTFTTLIRMGGEPRLVEDMVLYWTPEDGYWLLPSQPGPFIALEPIGPRVSFREPFLDCHERASGVAAAAAKIIRATRAQEAI